MLDPKKLRNDLETVIKKLRYRGFQFDVEKFQALESKRIVLQKKTQELKTERNKLSKAIGISKLKGEDISDTIAHLGHMVDALKQNECALRECQKEFLEFQLTIPNILHDSVPQGASEEDNHEIHFWGKQPLFSFEPKDHVTLGIALGQMDFESASKLSGSRFVVLNRGVAHLHRALSQFMLDLHVNEHGYQEVYVPYLVNKSTLYGAGQLPKFKEDLFRIEGEQHDFNLIPTAEVPMVNLLRDQIIDVENLPLSLVAQTPCFRSEAGSYGKNVRGMIRQHQFQKVEMVQLVKPESSYNALESLRRHAEIVLERLELPYRTLLLCSGDTGFSASKTYDLEVWMPGQNSYVEISSCSNCEDFQARRMKARYRIGRNKPKLLHTLNGSGLAVGRTLIAVMENYQDEEGRIRIPKVLKSYMNGTEYIQ